MVEARILEAPAGAKLTKADCQSQARLQKKGVKTLSCPRVQTTSGAPATVQVGALIPLGSPELKLLAPKEGFDGLELQILPKSEAGKIKFAGIVKVRRLEREGPASGLVVSEFSAREQYFAGECKSGESILLRSEAQRNHRRLHLFLALSEVAAK